MIVGGIPSSDRGGRRPTPRSGRRTEHRPERLPATADAERRRQVGVIRKSRLSATGNHKAANPVATQRGTDSSGFILLELNA